MNHLAHSEASKSAKTAETNLKTKVDELENNNAKFESELRRYASLFQPNKFSNHSFVHLTRSSRLVSLFLFKAVPAF